MQPHRCIDDVAVAVEAGGPAGRDEAGRVVFLDDARAGMRRLQVAAVDDRGCRASRGPGRNRRGGAASAIAMSGARLAAAAAAARGASGMPRPIDFEADQFDRLLDPGAVAVGALVLGAEGFLERRERGPVEPAGRQRHAQLERLPLVMQAGAAPDLDAVGGEAVLGEPGPRLGFERIDDRLQFVGRDARAAARLRVRVK